MNAIRKCVLVLILVASLAPAAPVFAHPGGHGEQQVAQPPPPSVSEEPEDDGGSSGLLIAAVSIGLVGLGVTLGALKKMQTQKDQAARLASPTSSA
jgi:hypothetical protein